MKNNLKLKCKLFIIFLFLVSFFFIFKSNFLKLETFCLDFLLKNSTDKSFFNSAFQSSSEDIVILNIDDISQYELGETVSKSLLDWPWRRIFWARIINYLEIAKPKVLLLDILFENYEDNTFSGHSSDAVLADTLKLYDNIILSTTLSIPPEIEFQKNEYADAEISDSLPTIKSLDLINHSKIKEKTYFNHSEIPNIFVENTTIAVNNVEKSFDVKTRYFSPIYKIIKKSKVYYLPSVAFASALKYLDYQDELIIEDNKIIFPDHEIIIDNSGRNLINWHGETSTYKIIPLSSVIVSMLNKSNVINYDNEQIPLEYFKNKILIVSSTIANQNINRTPVSEKMSSAEIYATIIDNIINDTDILNFTNRKLISQLSVQYFFLICFSIVIFTAMLTYKSKNNFIALFLIMMLAFVYLACVSFVFIYPGMRILLPIVLPVYLMFVTFIVFAFYKTIIRKRNKKEIISLYSNSVSKKVLKSLIKTKNFKASKCQKQQITTMLCSIQNFVEISNKYEADYFFKVLNKFIIEITNEIHRLNGTVEFMQNGNIVAHWGYPIENDDDAINAIKCALNIISNIKLILCDKDNFKEECFFNISVVTDEAVLGYIDTNNRKKFTIISENIDICERIREIGFYTKKSVLISELTYQKSKQSIQSEYRGEVKIKNKENKIKIYEPINEIE